MTDAAPTPAAQDTLLEVNRLTTTFDTSRGRLRAVNDVSFTVNRGETLGIVGESGSGKSVLVRSIMDLLPGSAEVAPDSSVLFHGQDILTLDPAERRGLWGKRVSMIFQDPMTALNPVRKIGDQLSSPLRYHLGFTKKQARNRAVELLGRVGLSDPAHRLEQYPHELSGGMRQRVMIAIAIGCGPELLVADEPTTALDVTVQRQILDLLRELQREENMAMLLITHDLGVVAQHSDYVSVMYAGRIVERAPTRVFFRELGHRYSEALLLASPRKDTAPHSRLNAIGGQPPDMVNPPVGCAFSPRCAHSTSECEELPALQTTSPDHSFACHHPVRAHQEEDHGVIISG